VIVYKYTNRINGKVYVGITQRELTDRHKEHIREAGDGTYFHNAIAKYGVDSFSLEIIETVNTAEQLMERERYWIRRLNSFAYSSNPHGYNETTGGEGMTGHSGELNSQFGVSPKERMSAAKYSEWLAGIRKSVHRGETNYWFGTHPRDWMGDEKWGELMQNLSERWKGDNNPNRKNPKRGVDNPNFGRVHSNDVRARMSQGKKNKKIGEQFAVEIKRQYDAGGVTQREIAEKYGISRQSVGDIVNGRLYAHLFKGGESNG
jgi:group I intron endonuclease